MEERKNGDLELRVSALGLGIAVSEVDEIIERAVAQILLGLLVLVEDLDGGEALDAVLAADVAVDSAVDLSNRIRLVLSAGKGGELDPSGSEMTAVAAPGSKELDHDGLLSDDLVELLLIKRKDVLSNTLDLLLGLRLDVLAFLDELHVGLDSAGSVHFNGFSTIADVLDSGIAADLVLLGELVLDSAVNLSNMEIRASLDSELLPDGSKTLAVTAPGSKELDHPGALLGKNNVVLVQLEDLAVNRLLRNKVDVNLRLLLRSLTKIGILADIVKISLNSAGNTNILSSSTVLDVLDGGETTDTKLLGQLLLDSAVNLGNMELALGLLAQLLPGGSKTLAVTTPGSKELDKPNALTGLLLKVLIGENLHLGKCKAHKKCNRKERLHF